MKKLLSLIALTSSLFAGQVFADRPDGHQHHWMTYHLKITNTTAHVIIAPTTVVAHNGKYKMFEVTQPASDELVTMAETGNPGPLSMAAESDPNVYAVAVGVDDAGNPSPIPPGHSLMISIMAPRHAFFTLAGMLATTNDGFMAAVNIAAPRVHQSTHAHGMSYDAGSEMNNENCDYIPAPPCNNGINMRAEFDPVTGERISEGFVTIHNGVHGGADLNPKDLDWRGPTALITIHNEG